MTDPRDRAIEQLERDLEDPDLTAEDRREIMREIRDIARDQSDEDRWRDEGHSRGFSFESAVSP